MRTIIGTVTSIKMDKTIVVSVDEKKRHEKYKKEYKFTRKFYAHDEQNTCQLGDVVTIEETRPISKTKHWKVVSDNA